MRTIISLRCLGLALLIPQVIFPSSVLAETCGDYKKKDCQTIACLMKKNRCRLSGGGGSGPGGGVLFSKKKLDLYDSEQNN